MQLAREKSVRAWHTPKTEKIEMDIDLAEAFAEILNKEMEKPRLGCATTRELLDELRARIELDGRLEYKTVDIDN